MKMYDKTIIGLEEFSELTFKEKLSVYTKVANEYFKTAIEEDEKAKGGRYLQRLCKNFCRFEKDLEENYERSQKETKNHLQTQHR